MCRNTPSCRDVNTAILIVAHLPSRLSRYTDLCIAISVMLQHEGVTVATLGKSMSETFDILTGESAPASVLGVLLGELSHPPGFAGLLAGGEGPLPGGEPDSHAAEQEDGPAGGEARE